MSLSGAAMRVLLVEDDLVDAQHVRRVLGHSSSLQVEICVASSVRDAIAQLEEAAFDVLLVDLNLPDSRGIETVKRLVEHCSEAAVIVLTGTDDEALGAEAIAAGAQDYLCKDQVEAALLVRTIRYAQERNHLLSEREEAREDVLVATTKEQLRIGRELHDGVSQLQAAALQQANRLFTLLDQSDNLVQAHAKRLVDLLQQTQTEIRTAVQGLVPPELIEQGLPMALSKLTQQWHNTNGIRCVCQVSESLRIPSQHVAFHLYRISQEALHNAVRHARADRIQLVLLGTKRSIRLEVQDNGCGFDVGQLSKGGGQLGLRSMCQRATAIGGKLTIQSQPGKGTAVVCIVPLATRRLDAGAKSQSA